MRVENASALVKAAKMASGMEARSNIGPRRSAIRLAAIKRGCGRFGMIRR